MKNKTKNNSLLKKAGITILSAFALANTAFADIVGYGIDSEGTKYATWKFDKPWTEDNKNDAWHAAMEVYGLKNTKENEKEIADKIRKMQDYNKWIKVTKKNDNIVYRNGEIKYKEQDGLRDYYAVGTELKFPYDWTKEEKRAFEKKLEERVDGKDISQDNGLSLQEIINQDTLFQNYVSSKKDKSKLKLNLFGNKNIDLAGICLDYDIALSRHNDPVKFVVGVGAFYNDQILNEKQFEEVISENQYPLGSDIVYDDIKTKETISSGLIGKVGIKYKKLGLYLNGRLNTLKKQKLTTRNAIQYDVDGNILNAGSDPTEIKENTGTYLDFYPSLDLNIYKGLYFGVGLNGDDKIFNVGIDL